MAEKKVAKKQDVKPKSKLVPIEELAKRQDLRPSIFSGMKVSFGWAEGLAMSEDEFERAKNNWLKKPVCKK